MNEQWDNVTTRTTTFDCHYKSMKSCHSRNEKVRLLYWLVAFMVLHATFNNISVMSWQSVLLVVKPEYQEKTTNLLASHWQTLSHNVFSRTPLTTLLHKKTLEKLLTVIFKLYLFNVQWSPNLGNLC
jgi:hypothetical protein